MGVPTFLETGHMADGFPIRLIYTGAQFNYAAHWHDEVELVVVNGKKARIGVNEQILELDQGDMLLIKPGDVHYFLPGTERLTILLFRLELLTGSFTSEVEMQELGALFNQTTVIPASSQGNPGPYVEAIAAEKKNQRPGYRWLMVSRLYDLIVLLLRTAPPADANNTAPCWPCGLSSKKFEFLEAVCEYLEEHYAEPIKLEQVAEHMKFSKFHICKLFKEIKGITLMEYLNHFRIIKSEWALLFRQDSILEIAISHGFNNVNSYNRLFKKYNNCTPSEFRKRHRSNIAKYQG
ncbi:AraC family transcriptional regulator [Paenibacillus silvae]|uniref:AraC family transcriptional regulator n=1 Tax=Paenibacillus TaxID=44249 RepID=UPI001C118D10|nr:MULTISPECIES: AraC family transcriptional regulator [Paenibacillus]MBU5351482.1 AraC family transcriptional regulator [Paenibacillus barcinonensis]MDM5277895.1 AraC family transcriptional regulator [Paenibacillus silvae]